MNAARIRNALEQRFGRLVSPPAKRAHETIAARGEVLAHLRPKTVRHVQAMLAYCQDQSITIHPASGGVNWGYGANLPWSVGPAVMLDLSGLNAVLGYDDRFGILRVQPGVTFADAQQYLQKHRSTFMMNPIGGSPRGSVLANGLERGHGTGPYTDRFGALRRLRVILPDGTETTTDFSEQGGAGAHRWGVGPTLRGLFSQSAFGIVVEADCLLAPRPKYSEAVSAWLFEPSKIQGFVERYREIRSTLRLAIRSGHRLAAEAAAANPDRPWPERTERTGFPLFVSLQYAANDAAGLASQRDQAKTMLRGARAEVEVVSNWPEIVEPSLSGWSSRVHTRYAPRLRSDAVTEHSVRAAYRVRASKVPGDRVDLDDDGVGLYWSTPVVPMVGTDVSAVIDAAERISVRHRVEPDITLVTIDDWRYLDGIFGFLFDATEPKALSRAQKAFDAFQTFLQKGGYPTYRAGIQHSVESVLPASRLELLRKVGAAVDPNGILSPWRLRSS